MMKSMKGSAKEERKEETNVPRHASLVHVQCVQLDVRPALGAHDTLLYILDATS